MKPKLLALVFACLPGAAMADMPNYVTRYLPFDGWAVDINNHGVVLQHTDNTLLPDSYLVTSAGNVKLGTLGGTGTLGHAINDSGIAVGEAWLAGNTSSHAFIYEQGAIRDIGTLGGTNSSAVAINNAGLVAGTSDIATGGTRAFIYTTQGGMRDIGTLGGAQSYTYDVSETGDVLGRAQTASGAWHTFLYRDGVMTDIQAEVGDAVYGLGPNGEIYGTQVNADEWEIFSLRLARSAWHPEGVASPSDMANGYMVGYNSWGTNVMIATPEGTWLLGSLAGLGSSIVSASAVNDDGQVLAFVGGEQRWALLSPVPEPGTVAMLGLGLSVIAVAGRRRSRHCA